MSQKKPQDSSASAGTGFAPDEPFLGSGPLLPENATDPETKRPIWVDRLQRTTSSGRFIPEVDGLRFIAVMSVIIFHITAHISFKVKELEPLSFASKVFLPIANHGDIGVQLFFAISGFILALPFASYSLKAGRPVSLRSYYLRRLTRLEPPYIITLLLFFILIIVVLKSPIQETFAHLLASVFYLHNLIYASASPINVVAWSLEVEVQFYLLAPFLASLFRVRPALVRRLSMFGLMIIFTAIQALWGDVPRVNYSILGQGQFFVAGFLLADFYLTRSSESEHRVLFWDIVFFIGWPLLVLALLYAQFAHWITPFLILAIYAATLQGKWGRQLLSFPLITVIGGMCYSIYLIHFQVVALVWRVSSKVIIGNDFMPNFIMQFCLILPVIFVLSVIFYLAVEKPCMSKDWPKKLASRLGTKN